MDKHTEKEVSHQKIRVPEADHLLVERYKVDLKQEGRRLTFPEIYLELIKKGLEALGLKKDRDPRAML